MKESNARQFSSRNRIKTKGKVFRAGNKNFQYKTAVNFVQVNSINVFSL